MTKLIALLCGVSLVFNAALLYFLASGSDGGGRISASANLSPSAAHSGSTEKPTIDPSVWPGLQTDELPALLTRLREAGFPTDVIRAIISAEVNERFSARRKALDPDAANRPYWKNRPRDPKIDASLRQLSREQDRVVRDLMGKDANTGIEAVYYNRQLDGVPAEKKADVQQLIRDYNEK